MSQLRRIRPPHIWTFYAEVLRWSDGDTVWLKVDKGMRDTSERAVRLVAIDTPEVYGVPKALRAPGEAASAFVRELAPPGSLVLIETHKPKGHNYGRWLGEVWTLGPAGQLSINQQLLDAGLAELEDY